VLGFTALPCVIEQLDDVEANLRLLIGNQQEGNDPLDVGLNALDTVEKSKGGRGVTSELSVSGFASRIGKTQGYLTQVTQAATVYRKVITQVMGFSPTGRTKHLFEIHSAPSPTWPMLATLLQSNDWSVKDTKAAVDRVKEVSAAIPAWFAAPVNLEKAAMEPGFAKALVASLKVMDGCHARLPASVTVYALVPTDETKEINGRECRKLVSVGSEYRASLAPSRVAFPRLPSKRCSLACRLEKASYPACF
jgi:ParB-like chromosome segregation protein Spo0J